MIKDKIISQGGGDNSVNLQAEGNIYICNNSNTQKALNNLPKKINDIQIDSPISVKNNIITALSLFCSSFISLPTSFLQDKTKENRAKSKRNIAKIDSERNEYQYKAIYLNDNYNFRT